ncbi:hypothetical protein PQC13_gp153 [Synechococcus phage S-SRM01]|uniref:Uncharacterized protein n=1 Tax=Synechococcus phage S-SRM01 TaxID=2781608 RepID=A0A879R3K2_9CAUD|nr:hypothetical protein PQC13_gp153 [Synechococcus phage S-SRM01]QPX48118.1 hypothetical protein [Synechococcus phage S-SRM01]
MCDSVIIQESSDDLGSNVSVVKVVDDSFLLDIHNIGFLLALVPLS